VSQAHPCDHPPARESEIAGTAETRRDVNVKCLLAARNLTRRISEKYPGAGPLARDCAQGPNGVSCDWQLRTDDSRRFNDWFWPYSDACCRVFFLPLVHSKDDESARRRVSLTLASQDVGSVKRAFSTSAGARSKRASNSARLKIAPERARSFRSGLETSISMKRLSSFRKCA
jgi:hypothetical protein